MSVNFAKRKRLVQKMHQDKHATKIQAQWRGKVARNRLGDKKLPIISENIDRSAINRTELTETYKQEWPTPILENFENVDSFTVWPNLNGESKESWNWLKEHSKILIRCVTWNLCGNSPPLKEEIKKLIVPLNKYVY